MRTIRDITVFEGVPMLVRATLNVPFQDGVISNDYRLRRTAPTIAYLAARGARVIVIGHLGSQGTETLAPVADALGKLVSGVSFFPETTGERVRAAVRALAPGQILVLENLRRDKREQANDLSFAQELASLADVFVQDSFDACHREHASILGIPTLLPSYAGLLVEDEVRELSRARTPKSPSLAAIGGMKFSTKEPVISSLLSAYDRVFVGGAIANDFLRAEGQDVGKSLVSGANPEALKEILKNPKMILPIDSVMKNDIILDQGPGTTALLADLAGQAKTILWNGPFGNCESGFTEATDAFARAIAESRAYSVVGGGDTVASVAKLGLLSRFSFVSTGGGSMLQFLAKGTLPGLDVLG